MRQKLRTDSHFLLSGMSYPILSQVPIRRLLRLPPRASLLRSRHQLLLDHSPTSVRKNMSHPGLYSLRRHPSLPDLSPCRRSHTLPGRRCLAGHLHRPHHRLCQRIRRNIRHPRGRWSTPRRGVWRRSHITAVTLTNRTSSSSSRRHLHLHRATIPHQDNSLQDSCRCPISHRPPGKLASSLRRLMLSVHLCIARRGVLSTRRH